jgi:uncharacterized membrane protein (UPF0127 family)
MLKIKSCVSIILLLFFLISTVYGENLNKRFGNGKVILLDQSLTFDVEVARTELQRNIGLMYRDFLPQNNGMLFVFEQEGLQRVWMKNTLVSLDVIFISAEAKVVSIIKDLQPCLKQSCRIFESSEKAKYILELNAGMVRKSRIETGQQVLFEL